MLKIAWSKFYNHPLPEGHRFPMIKYDLIPEQLIYEGSARDVNFFNPGFLEEPNILLAHRPEYWQKLSEGTLTPREARKTGFPYSKMLVERECNINQGTIDCCHYALQYGLAMNVAGGTHHAYPDHGEGFCLLNDIAIAAFYLLKKQLAKKILIIDLDVHQGNGSSVIFQNEPRVFTFSMHGKNNYPLKKENSDLDVALEDGTNDAFYLKTLKNKLPELLDEFSPDFIFYQSGVDVLATDKLGRLGLSIQGCKERDRFVFDICKKNNLPIVAAMGGGYSPKVSTVVDAHVNTFRLAQEIFF